MKKRRAARRISASPPREPDQALGSLNPEPDPVELAGWVVEVVAAQSGLVGARLWRLAGGTPAVWRESGKLPGAEPAKVQKLLVGKHVAAANRRACLWVVGRDAEPFGVLEACGGGADFSGEQPLFPEAESRTSCRACLVRGPSE